MNNNTEEKREGFLRETKNNIPIVNARLVENIAGVVVPERETYAFKGDMSSDGPWNVPPADWRPSKAAKLRQRSNGSYNLVEENAGGTKLRQRITSAPRFRRNSNSNAFTDHLERLHRLADEIKTPESEAELRRLRQRNNNYHERRVRDIMADVEDGDVSWDNISGGRRRRKTKKRRKKRRKTRRKIKKKKRKKKKTKRKR